MKITTTLRLNTMVHHVRRPLQHDIYHRGTFLPVQPIRGNQLGRLFIRRVRFPYKANLIRGGRVNQLNRNDPRILVLRHPHDHLFNIIRLRSRLLPNLTTMSFNPRLLRRQSLTTFTTLRRLRSSRALSTTRYTRHRTRNNYNLTLSVTPVRVRRSTLRRTFSSIC